MEIEHINFWKTMETTETTEGTETKEKCERPHCGSKDFFVHEFEYWKASVDEENPNTINCWHKSSGIDLVECAKCQADITQLSLNPEFNFSFQ